MSEIKKRVRPKSSWWDDELIARAAGLKRAGFSAKSIAIRLGLTESAVRSQMQAKGCKSPLKSRGLGKRLPFGRLALETAVAREQSMEDVIEARGDD